MNIAQKHILNLLRGGHFVRVGYQVPGLIKRAFVVSIKQKDKGREIQPDTVMDLWKARLIEFAPELDDGTRSGYYKISSTGRRVLEEQEAKNEVRG